MALSQSSCFNTLLKRKTDWIISQFLQFKSRNMFTSLKNKLSVIFFSNLVRYLLVRIWKDTFGKNLNTQIIALSKNVREFSPLTSLLKGTAIFGIHIFFLKTLINVYIIFFSKGMRRIPPGQFPRSFPPHGEFPPRSIPWIRNSPGEN